LANYDKALKVDPNNYDVNYNLGVIAFNEAVILNKKVGDMGMDEYKKDGKAAEATRDDKFKEALKYFEKAYSLKKEEDVKENLKQLYRVLKMEDKLKELGE
jgi:tetratricopeptide (TPR) repeat protein